MSSARRVPAASASAASMSPTATTSSRARYDHVTDTRLCTLLSNEAGVSIGTVEHLMAALAGTGVTHAEIEIDGPEVPIMDGSAQRFVRAIPQAGLEPLLAALGPRAIRIRDGSATCRATPSSPASPADTLSIAAFQIDFADAAIGFGRRGRSSWRTAPSCAKLPTAAPSAGRPRSRRCAWRASRSVVRSTTPSSSTATGC